MQYSTLAAAALSVVGAMAQSTTSSAASASSGTPSGSVQVHVVQVGNSNGSLVYSPSNVKAAVGDMVQFQFAPNNHTVTQSTFDAPCSPVKTTGIYSGFMPVKATDTEIPTYTILINNTTPIWLYCSQGMHCQKGMVMVINENTAANSTRSLANYASLAAKAATNSAPSAPADGVAGTAAASGSSSSTGSSPKATGTNAASSVRAGSALGFAGLVAAGFAFLM